MAFTVLLYYKFATIPAVESFFKDQQTLCKQLGLMGRVLIAEEGINGTLAGSSEAVETYKQALWAHPLFTDLIFKESLSEVQPFPKLQVKLRKEIIALHYPKSLDIEAKRYLSPAQLEELYQKEEEFYILDVRNNYESAEGIFEGAITPEIAHFRQLPHIAKQYTELKNKKIVMYCTGGIRCEKAAALFADHGYRDVLQLEGGIVNYLQQYPNSHFKGSCYVFDQRMGVTQAEIAEHGKVTQAPPVQAP